MWIRILWKKNVGTSEIRNVQPVARLRLSHKHLSLSFDPVFLECGLERGWLVRKGILCHGRERKKNRKSWRGREHPTGSQDCVPWRSEAFLIPSACSQRSLGSGRHFLQERNVGPVIQEIPGNRGQRQELQTGRIASSNASRGKMVCLRCVINRLLASGPVALSNLSL